MTEEAKGKRLYLVKEERDHAGPIKYLIEAVSQASAIKKAAEERFSAAPATARDVDEFHREGWSAQPKDAA